MQLPVRLTLYRMARQRTKWSKAEDELLEQAILDQGSSQRPRVTPISALSSSCPDVDDRDNLAQLAYELELRGPKKLTIIIESQKKIDWNYISSFIPRRNNKDCRKRWYYKTGNRVNKGPWQKQEDRRLISTVAKYGKRYFCSSIS